MEDRTNATVLEWIDSIDQEVLWTTTISLAELVSGINRLPEGRRRAGLDANLWQVLASSFSGRILAFDQAAAMAYGTIVPIRLSRGRPISIPDAQIAAIAMSHDATLATRNVKDFEGTGVALVNPWDVPDAPQAGAGGRSCTADGCNWNTGRWFDIARHTARTGLVCPDPRSSDFRLVRSSIPRFAKSRFVLRGETAIRVRLSLHPPCVMHIVIAVVVVLLPISLTFDPDRGGFVVPLPIVVSGAIASISPMQ